VLNLALAFAAYSVDVDERRLAYVQTRYPGWVKDVFVNATYQFVRKGKPLFTIYSPWFWQSSRSTKPAENAAAEHPPMEGFTLAPTESAPPAFAPVELSPERMQSIGVRTGRVEYKLINSEIRAIGTRAGRDRCGLGVRICPHRPQWPA
jgi:hypothetical protein